MPNNEPQKVYKLWLQVEEVEDCGGERNITEPFTVYETENVIDALRQLHLILAAHAQLRAAAEIWKLIEDERARQGVD
jgi:hypothetical protein